MEVIAPASPKLAASDAMRAATIFSFFLSFLQIFLRNKNHRKPHLKVLQPSTGEMLSADEEPQLFAVDCLSTSRGGGERKRLCNLAAARSEHNVQPCRSVENSGRVGGTRRLAHCPAGGLEPGGDPVCSNHTHVHVRTRTDTVRNMTSSHLLPPLMTV